MTGESAKSYLKLTHINIVKTPAVQVKPKDVVELNTAKFTIGRAETCNLNIPLIWISRDHCVLTRKGSSWTLKGLSINEIWINKIKSITKGETHNLVDKDEISFSGPSSQIISYRFRNNSGNSSENAVEKTSKTPMKPPSKTPIKSPLKTLMKTPKKAPMKTRAASRVQNELHLLATPVIQLSPARPAVPSCSSSDRLAHPPLGPNIVNVAEKAPSVVETISEAAALQAELDQVQARITELEAEKEQEQMKTEAEIKGLKEDLERAENRDDIYKPITDLLREHFKCQHCNDIPISYHILNCGHAFCLLCLMKLPNSAVCPTCKVQLRFLTKQREVQNYLGSVMEHFPHLKEAYDRRARNHEKGILDPAPFKEPAPPPPVVQLDESQQSELYTTANDSELMVVYENIQEEVQLVEG